MLVNVKESVKKVGKSVGAAGSAVLVSAGFALAESSPMAQVGVEKLNQMAEDSVSVGTAVLGVVAAIALILMIAMFLKRTR